MSFNPIVRQAVVSNMEELVSAAVTLGAAGQMSLLYQTFALGAGLFRE